VLGAVEDVVPAYSHTEGKDKGWVTGKNVANRSTKVEKSVRIETKVGV